MSKSGHKVTNSYRPSKLRKVRDFNPCNKSPHACRVLLRQVPSKPLPHLHKAVLLGFSCLLRQSCRQTLCAAKHTHTHSSTAVKRRRKHRHTRKHTHTYTHKSQLIVEGISGPPAGAPMSSHPSREPMPASAQVSAKATLLPSKSVCFAFRPKLIANSTSQTAEQCVGHFQ